MNLYSIATKNYACPKCKAAAGEYCQTPKGQKTKGGVPHTERVSLLTHKEVNSCRVKLSRPAFEKSEWGPWGGDGYRD